MLRTIAALFLDLDGSLVDSEPLHCEAHRRFLHGRGLMVSDADIVGNIGKSDRSFYRRIMEQHQLVEEPEAWMADKNRILIQLYRDGLLHTMPGALDLLDAASCAGVIACVVTSSNRELCVAALEATGLAARLPIRIAHEDVVNRKPAPDPYLLAASRLGVPPANCLVIEDSVFGVTAARVAGMRVVAMRGQMPEADVLAAGAQRMISDLREALPFEQWSTGAA